MPTNKPYIFLVWFVSAALTITAGAVLQDDVVASMASWRLFDSMYDNIPMIHAVTSGFPDLARAKVTWAVGWLFAPLSLIAMLHASPPWSEEMRRFHRERAAASLPQNLAAFFVLVGIAVLIVMSDVGVIKFFSIFRADPFLLPQSLDRAPLILRAPHTSVLGMVVYAWFVPIAFVGLYYVYLTLAFSFPHRLRRIFAGRAA